MFNPETEVVKLQSTLGPVGTIQAWNPWNARHSVDDAKWWVSKIARLSHGLEETEDYIGHFDHVVNKLHHESVLEFVPVLSEREIGNSLPQQSLRHNKGLLGIHGAWEDCWNTECKLNPATAFLVEAPIFVARQWMRHRSFAYLEMSRRYVKGSKVAWEFYGLSSDCLLVYQPDESPDGTPVLREATFHGICVQEYQRRIANGWAPEIARGCIPVEAMTKFWVAGFDWDWQAFIKLRNDPHAQAETRAFASWIASYLESKA